MAASEALVAAVAIDPSTISDLAAQSGELYLNQGGNGGSGEVWARNECRRRYSRSEMVALQWAHGDEDEKWDKRLEELDPILVDKSKQRRRGKGGDLCRRRYTREEMEAVGLALGEDVQKKRWSEIYGSLAPVIARELDQILVTNCQKRSNGKVDGSQRLKKNLDEPCFGDFSDVDAATMSGMCLKYINDKSEGINLSDDACDYSFFVDADEAMIEDTFEDEDDSEDEYTIRRPAFLVLGEPDFNSGPPQDGLEYLRRVRWEAARIPKVKVASLREKQVLKEQTPYMPNIPDIASCPEHLMPSKVWEDLFLKDFSQLRQDLSQLEVSSSGNPDCLLLATSASEDSKGPIRNWPKLTSPPMLSTVMRMEPVSRVSMLRNRIRSLEPASTLSRENCLWLFALCAVVDTPFDADTSASIRCLLRKCSSLRALKEEVDDEVVMLNMLISLSGKYFGQAEIYEEYCLTRSTNSPLNIGL